MKDIAVGFLEGQLAFRFTTVIFDFWFGKCVYILCNKPISLQFLIKVVY